MLYFSDIRDFWILFRRAKISGFKIVKPLTTLASAPWMNIKTIKFHATEFFFS